MKEEAKHIISTKHPAIIVIAHDRDKSLQRLLKSLDNAQFLPSLNISLIISIDQNSNNTVYSIAEDYQWSHGTKRIITHKQHLGLKEHVHFCGDLISELESAILLEDDTVVAPYFYDYAVQAQHFFKDKENIAGISLYSYAVAESCFFPFQPYDDGFDNYFIQIPSSWGQLFTKEQWKAFKDWTATTTITNPPSYTDNWGQHSWKKMFMKYMIDKDIYFVFPRKSHSSNFEDRGTNAQSNGIFQVELQQYRKEYHFTDIANSLAIYDAWFEMKAHLIKRLCTPLSSYDFTVDLYGGKYEEENKSFILTTRKGNSPLLSFGSKMQPLFQNLIHKIEGTDINLYHQETQLSKNPNSSLFFPLAKQCSQQELKPSTRLKIGLAIPLQKLEEQKLLDCIKSLLHQSYSNWEGIIVCSPQDYNSVESLLRQHQIPNQISVISSSSKDELIKIETAWNKTDSEILCWFPPIIIEKERFATVSGIFDSFKLVSLLKCLNEKKDILKHRWNTNLLIDQLETDKKVISTSQIFISKNNWNKMGASFDHRLEEVWLVHLLSKFPFFLFVDNMVRSYAQSQNIWKGEYADIKMYREREAHSNDAKSKLFKWFYKNKFSYLRSFYPLYHNLTDVIRYDKQNKSYYFDRY